MARVDRKLTARDGLPARNNGAWAKEKLSFLDEFVPAALQATTGKVQRYFVDLFAGPGVNRDEESGEEFPGSALRVIPMRSPANPAVHFTHVKLVNKDVHDHRALEARVQHLFEEREAPMPRRQVELLNADANKMVHRIMREIAPQAFAFVLADIESPSQLPFGTVKALKSHGHSSVDLYVLFPLDMALNRMLSYNSATVEASARVLTDFFGTEAWRDMAGRRQTDAQSPELRRQALDLYTTQLRGLGWSHVQVVRDVKRRGDAGLYKMIYASNHPAGGRIADHSARHARTRDQLDLGF